MMIDIARRIAAVLEPAGWRPELVPMDGPGREPVEVRSRRSRHGLAWVAPKDNHSLALAVEGRLPLRIFTGRVEGTTVRDHLDDILQMLVRHQDGLGGPDDVELWGELSALGVALQVFANGQPHPWLDWSRLDDSGRLAPARDLGGTPISDDTDFARLARATLEGGGLATALQPADAPYPVEAILKAEALLAGTPYFAGSPRGSRAA